MLPQSLRARIRLLETLVASAPSALARAGALAEAVGLERFAPSGRYLRDLHRLESVTGSGQTPIPGVWNPGQPLPNSGLFTILDWNPAAGVSVSGGFVTTVADQSGNGNTGGKNPNIVVGTGPTLNASDASFGGAPSFGFSQAGSAQSLFCGAFSGYSTSYTVFLCYIDTATLGADPGGALYGAKGLVFGHVTKQIFDVLSSATAGGNTDALITGPGGTSSFNIGSDWALTGAAAVYMHQDNATNASHIVRLNHVTQARSSTISATDPGAGTAGGQSFSVIGDPDGANRRSGRLARVLAFNGTIPLADIQAVEAFFLAAYGVS